MSEDDDEEAVDTELSVLLGREEESVELRLDESVLDELEIDEEAL